MEVRVSPFPCCDFCSDVEPRFLENCESFQATLLDGTVVGRSRGDWASCAMCHALVQARDWRALKRRAVDAMQRKYPNIPKKRLDYGVDLIHRQFRTHKPVEDLNP